MKRTTLCYIKHNGAYLMLYRNAKPNDPNQAKWLGIGGKLEDGESPSDCNVREVYEETGLRLESAIYHGVIEFRSDEWEDEDMYLFSSEDFIASAPGNIDAGAGTSDTIGPGEDLCHPPLPSCDEGELAWISEDELLSLPMWEGDRAFLTKLMAGDEHISMTLRYTGEKCEIEDRKDNYEEMNEIKSDDNMNIYKNNLELLRQAFPWDGEALCSLAAELLANDNVKLYDKTSLSDESLTDSHLVSIDIMKEYEEIIKSKCSIFSVFRGHIKLTLICYMAEEQDPRAFLRQVLSDYDHLKGQGSAEKEILALSAIVVASGGERIIPHEKIAKVLLAARSARFI